MGTQALAKRVKLVGLTRDQVRRLPKVHIGFEKFVEPLAEIAEAYADEMGRGGIDVAAMRVALATYQDLAAVQRELEGRLALVIHTRQLNKAKAWSQELVIYNKARVAGQTNMALAQEIEEFAKFMKPKVRRKKRG
jgi:hypothetical protein